MNRRDDPLSRLLCDGLRCRALARLHLATAEGRVFPREVRPLPNGRFSAEYAGGLHETLSLRPAGEGLVIRRRLLNRSSAPVRLVELGLRLEGLRIGGDPARDFFYHAENPRIYQRMAIPVAAKRTQAKARDTGFDAIAGNRWCDPGVVTERIGDSPYQPFPAILVSNHGTRRGLIHGTLSQRVFFHSHLLRHENESLTWEILSSFKALPWREVAKGEALEDVAWLGRTRHADDLERIFEGYALVLRRHFRPKLGASTVNRHSVVWGSWNDGIFRDFDEQRIFRVAEFLKAELPTVEWVQVDDGYAALSNRIDRAHGLGMPYEGAKGVDRKRFPKGFRHFTDGIRKRGLRPAVWIGGHVPACARICRERPGWFLDYSYRLTDPLVPDPSRPEVRRYMARALDAFTRKGGFEGIKLDFWSYAFEDSHPILTRRGRSGHEWRTWWLGEMRRRLPRDGMLQGGCDIAMGNPFLGEWFTNYRYGIDIGSGHWENVVTNLLWAAACCATHTGDLSVPNSDAIGLFPGLSDREALFCVNFCLVSRSLVEIAGWLHEHRAHPRLAWLRKAICCPNNGADVSFADYDYRSGKEPAPPIWFIRTPHFSRREAAPGLPRRTVGVFNLGDKARRFSLTAPKLRLPAGRWLATDVWSLETVPLRRLADLPLGGRSSRLLAVSPETAGQQVLDANVAVASSRRAGRRLALRFARGGDLTLVLSREPSQLRIDGRPARAAVTRGKGNFILRLHLPSASTLSFT